MGGSGSITISVTFPRPGRYIVRMQVQSNSLPHQQYMNSGVCCIEIKKNQPPAWEAGGGPLCPRRLCKCIPRLCIQTPPSSPCSPTTPPPTNRPTQHRPTPHLPPFCCRPQTCGEPSQRWTMQFLFASRETLPAAPPAAATQHMSSRSSWAGRSTRRSSGPRPWAPWLPTWGGPRSICRRAVHAAAPASRCCRLSRCCMSVLLLLCAMCWPRSPCLAFPPAFCLSVSGLFPTPFCLFQCPSADPRYGGRAPV